LAIALAALNGYSEDEFSDPESGNLRADYEAHAAEVKRLYLALFDTYTAEGVALVLRSWANKAEGLAGGMVAT
jgi:hypothetical protein